MDSQNGTMVGGMRLLVSIVAFCVLLMLASCGGPAGYADGGDPTARIPTPDPSGVFIPPTPSRLPRTTP